MSRSKQTSFGAIVSNLIYLAIGTVGILLLSGRALTPFGVQADSNTSIQAAVPEIEVAHGSGVAGYPVRIFGANFGSTQGALSVLGKTANVLLWEDGYVDAIVPNVAAGEGNIQLTTAGGDSDFWPFTVYEIDPDFQTPTDKLQNVAFGKPASLSGLESDFCFEEPGKAELAPEDFLTDFRCGFDGLTNVGSATFAADSSLGSSAVIAVNTGVDLAGETWFKFTLDSNWYPAAPGFKSVPADYSIEFSSNSTNGLDGSWLLLKSVSDNDRVTRQHRVTVPAGGYSWVRMRVTDSTGNNSVGAGKDFEMREIQVFKPRSGSTTILPDTFALYGDSITADAFSTIGSGGLATKVNQLRNDGSEISFTAFGLSGKNSDGFIDSDTSASDIFDAFAIDDNQNNITYWGVGIGTNDANDGASNIDFPNSNIAQYDERLEGIVQTMLANGQIPIIARIPDTDESQGGFGDLATKKKVLADIDRIAATYRLIPGPDFYSTFRRNIETENSSWFRDGDGTHHVTGGILQMIDQWASAFVRGTSGTVEATPTPTATTTPPPAATATPTVAATATPSTSPEGTATLPATSTPIRPDNLNKTLFLPHVLSD